MRLRFEAILSNSRISSYTSALDGWNPMVRVSALHAPASDFGRFSRCSSTAEKSKWAGSRPSHRALSPTRVGPSKLLNNQRAKSCGSVGRRVDMFEDVLFQLRGWLFNDDRIALRIIFDGASADI